MQLYKIYGKSKESKEFIEEILKGTLVFYSFAMAITGDTL